MSEPTSGTSGGAPPRSAQPVRIDGVVVALSDPPPARWQVRIGNRRWQRSEPGWFEVETGVDRVWVEVSSLVEVFGAATEEDGLLEELAPRAGFIGELGAPGTAATLVRVALARGDQVAVLGEDVGPGVVRGQVIAIGADAPEALDERIARRAVTPLRPRSRATRRTSRGPGRG